MLKNIVENLIARKYPSRNVDKRNQKVPKCWKGIGLRNGSWSRRAGQPFPGMLMKHVVHCDSWRCDFVLSTFCLRKLSFCFKTILQTQKQHTCVNWGIKNTKNPIRLWGFESMAGVGRLLGTDMNCTIWTANSCSILTFRNQGPALSHLDCK